MWVYGLPSDYVDGLGMIAGTNHAHLNLGYRAVVVGEEPPDDGDGNGGDLADRLDSVITELVQIRDELRGAEG